MSTQKISQYLLLAIVAIFIVSVEYTYNTTEYHATEPTVTASGIVTDRFENDYSCGSKGRYTCYARYFEINGQRHQVSDEVFKNNSVGSSVTLIKTIDPAVTRWQSSSEVLHMLFCVIAMVLSIMCIIHFLIWACFNSDRYTYKEYFKKCLK